MLLTISFQGRVFLFFSNCLFLIWAYCNDILSNMTSICYKLFSHRMRQDENNTVNKTFDANSSSFSGDVPICAAWNIGYFYERNKQDIFNNICWKENRILFPFHLGIMEISSANFHHPLAWFKEDILCNTLPNLASPGLFNEPHLIKSNNFFYWFTDS